MSAPTMEADRELFETSPVVAEQHVAQAPNWAEPPSFTLSSSELSQDSVWSEFSYKHLKLGEELESATTPPREIRRFLTGARSDLLVWPQEMLCPSEKFEDWNNLGATDEVETPQAIFPESWEDNFIFDHRRRVLAKRTLRVPVGKLPRRRASLVLLEDSLSEADD